ncbi:MAG: translocation/assembly module TamB domain-containing protein, partial [Bacteroidales bacterium]|nr:translocation/assembly module TamB domain-containing protein [Bacteroidales bacterium]
SEFAINDNVALVKMAVTGEYEDILFLGSFDYGKETNPIDINLDIKTLDLGDLNYLLADYIKDAKGNLAGQIKVAGNLNNPVVNGNLNFADAGIGLISLNNYFTLGNESILIKDNVIDFDKLSIVNKQNQLAKIIGQISFGSGKRTYSNLQVITDNMEILNSTRKDNDMVYGILKAQTNIKIKGFEDNLKVDANVEIDRSTDITYIFPETLSINDNMGVVRFCKYGADTLLNKELSNEHTLFSLEIFDDVKAQIDIDNGAQFKLFFDSGGKNLLDASINGTMNYVLYENNTEISGIFEVDEGQLHYGIPMVTVEDYKIEPGSFITLSNDIYNPHVNIIASANVRASTEGLIADYNKVMTFKILLYMNGELNNVKLKFDISSETGDAMVSARLAQLTEQERNINALNLLARGAFVISVHGTEAGGTSMAAAQIDKFYANQLNHLISENVHFVDLHFDVQSFTDYGSSGEQIFRRNYYYNIGKSFLKDRARINYKGSLGFTSDIKAEQINSNFVQNELDVEVKITKDGIFRGVFFRKDKYEGLLEGEVVETGGGIRIKKNFYSVKDIFTKDKKQKDKSGDKDLEEDE